MQRSIHLVVLGITLAAAVVHAQTIPVPPPDAADPRIEGSLRDINQAQDPSTAVAAYAASQTFAPGNIQIESGYLRRMAELGVPALAEAQAVDLTHRDPQNGLAWAVVAHMSAARGQRELAQEQMTIAERLAPDDQLVKAAAAQLRSNATAAAPQQAAPAAAPAAAPPPQPQPQEPIVSSITPVQSAPSSYPYYDTGTNIYTWQPAYTPVVYSQPVVYSDPGWGWWGSPGWWGPSWGWGLSFTWIDNDCGNWNNNWCGNNNWKNDCDWDGNNNSGNWNRNWNNRNGGSGNTAWRGSGRGNQFAGGGRDAGELGFVGPVQRDTTQRVNSPRAGRGRGGSSGTVRGRSDAPTTFTGPVQRTTTGRSSSARASRGGGSNSTFVGPVQRTSTPRGGSEARASRGGGSNSTFVGPVQNPSTSSRSVRSGPPAGRSQGPAVSPSRGGGGRSGGPAAGGSRGGSGGGSRGGGGGGGRSGGRGR